MSCFFWFFFIKIKYIYITIGLEFVRHKIMALQITQKPPKGLLLAVFSSSSAFFPYFSGGVLWID